MGVIWFLADGWLGRRPPGPMPQLQGGVRHGLIVSRFPDFWLFWGGRFGGTGILPKAALAVPGGPWVWSLGLFSSIFFSTSINKKKAIGRGYLSGDPNFYLKRPRKVRRTPEPALHNPRRPLDQAVKWFAFLNKRLQREGARWPRGNEVGTCDETNKYIPRKLASQTVIKIASQPQ